MKIPMEWLSGKTVLTAAEVRKLAPGSRVWIHRCYGRRGEHTYVRAEVVVKDGRKKLRYYDSDYTSVYAEIRNSESIAYTEDQEG